VTEQAALGHAPGDPKGRVALTAVVTDVGMGGVERARAEHGVAIDDFGNKQDEYNEKSAKNGERGETTKPLYVHLNRGAKYKLAHSQMLPFTCAIDIVLRIDLRVWVVR
jgi:hypothetical protein